MDVKYAWIGVDGKDVIFLNNFRWSNEWIPWEIFLVLLEGEVIYLSLPKNHFSKDLTISSDVAIFVTSKAMIRHPYDPIESRMKDTWQKVFEPSNQIPPFQHKDLTAGLKFFCDFVLLEEMWAFHIFARFYFILIHLTYP